ncbi:MAG: TetR family transcriptional regulator [Bradyrhizobium sp.]|nr:TetR family transcriptional regulator [Bradyrhizobium sp.]
MPAGKNKVANVRLVAPPAGDPSKPRLPQRSTGRLRYEKLLAATDGLLTERDASDISLYDIAEWANVPTASVYHFFPSPTAAFVGLAGRYLERLVGMLAEPLDHAALTGWQDVAAIKAGTGRQFYEEHIVAKKLFLGSEYTWQIRLQESLGNKSGAEFIVRDYQRHFLISDVAALAEKVEIAIGLIDATWSLSYIRHGFITDYYATEANRAFIGYMRFYLPEYLEKRAEPLPLIDI